MDWGGISNILPTISCLLVTNKPPALGTGKFNATIGRLKISIANDALNLVQEAISIKGNPYHDTFELSTKGAFFTINLNLKE